MEWVETMLCQNGQIQLLELHLNRLKWGLFQYGISQVDAFIQQATQTILAHLPKDSQKYKVRYLLNIDAEGHSIESIESTIFENSKHKIYQLGIYKAQFKKNGFPWNAKITDRKIYQSALKWANENQLDDALIINEKGHIIESSIFNIFILKNNILYTSPLSDLPVKGVFRTWVIQNSIFPIIEKPIHLEDILDADLLLLTNALRGIQLANLIQI